MVYGIQQRLGSLIDHYTVLCLTLALVILSLIGVGDVRVAGMAGIFLCLAGITRGDARVDLRIIAENYRYFDRGEVWTGIPFSPPNWGRREREDYLK